MTGDAPTPRTLQNPSDDRNDPGSRARERASCLPCPESQHLSAGWLTERIRKEGLAHVRKRWEARSRDESLPKEKRTYAAKRALRLASDVVPRLNACGRFGAAVACGCPGTPRARPYGCRQWFLCASCRRQRSPRLKMRLQTGLEKALVDAQRASKSHRRRQRTLKMLTLTVRHSGSLAKDREAIAKGWRLFYQRMNRRIGVFAYAGVWEVTSGVDGDGMGHVHAHVAVVWPWVDYAEARELWLESCPESGRLNFAPPRKDRRPSTPASMASYLGKYLGKGSDDEFTADQRAEISVATYNKRSVFTSHKFWQPFTPVCKVCHCEYHVVVARGDVVASEWRARPPPPPPEIEHTAEPYCQCHRCVALGVLSGRMRFESNA